VEFSRADENQRDILHTYRFVNDSRYSLFHPGYKKCRNRAD
jgi:hypothetical protein